MDNVVVAVGISLSLSLLQTVEMKSTLKCYPSVLKGYHTHHAHTHTYTHTHTQRERESTLDSRGNVIRIASQINVISPLLSSSLLPAGILCFIAAAVMTQSQTITRKCICVCECVCVCACVCLYPEHEYGLAAKGGV